jgi:hypothetical protein
MLNAINSLGHQTTSVPIAWADKRRVMAILEEVGARHGYSAPTFDSEAEYLTDEDRRREFGGVTAQTQVILSGILEGPTGQWIVFNIQDLSNDVDGTFADRLAPGKEEGLQVNTIALLYGANALLPEADRAEFERRLAPFDGLEQPEPTES